MNISAPFIERPIATSLLTVALLLAGIVAFPHIPVAPLPEVEYPTIQVNAQLPGASPDTLATSVATPLERMFGRIAGINQMTSSSSLGGTFIVLQFDLSRDVNAAARDVQAAINAARGQLPSNLPTNPSWRKVNPAEAPILVLTLTSDTATNAADVRRGRLDSGAEDPADSRRRRRESPGKLQARGSRGGESAAVEHPRRRSRSNWQCAQSGQLPLAQRPPSRSEAKLRHQHERPALRRQGIRASDRRLQERRAGPAFRCGHAPGCRRKQSQSGIRGRKAVRAAGNLPPAPGEHHRNRGPRYGATALPAGFHSGFDPPSAWSRTAPQPFAPRCTISK